MTRHITKTGYELVAFPIKRQIDCANKKKDTKTFLTARVIAQDMAMVLAMDNPVFDREQFLKLCGLQD